MVFLNCKSIHQMSLLSDGHSWILLQRMLFRQNLLLSDLVETGIDFEIAKNCKGLPLAIALIAGVLSKIDKTLGNWKVVAESVGLGAIFSLSYHNLPHHLKLCLLYMESLPVGYEIESDLLIRFWIRDGLIVQKSKMCLEDIAEDYMDDLISRNLLLAGTKRKFERTKTCYMHDLIQEFCAQEARNEKFMNVTKDCRQIHSEGSTDTRRQYSLYSEIYYDFVIGPKYDDNIRTRLALLELSENLGSTSSDNSIFHSKTFDQERRNQLECFSRHEADEDNKLILSGELEESLEILLSDLFQSSPTVEKLAIVGMAGIGKTTLAGKIFNDQRVSDRFDIRAWVKISQVYFKRGLLLQLLQCINQSRLDDIYGNDDGYLEELLYKSLKGRRYLIVMDDMWSIGAWTELKRIFADDKTGSRVLITSRRIDAMELLNCKSIHQMSLLSDNRSWNLMQEKVFGQDPCPSDLVETGKHIAKKCEGLPLAIVVVAGVLLQTGQTLEDWKVVAESVGSVVFNNQSPCQAIFSLSYQNLPHHLKSCFLYMGAFPVGYEIEAKTLFRLWIAEGFIVQKRRMYLEDVAEEYLNDLIGRSLLSAGRRRSNERVKTCHIHDLLQVFCIQEARKEKFMDVIKDCRQMDSKGRIDMRSRFSFHCEIDDNIYLTTSKSQAGSALFFRNCSSVVPDILLYYLEFERLKVLDIISLRFYNFPVEQISKLLLLRYLAFTALFELPTIVFELRKLETLVVNGPWLRTEIPVLPHEFWRCTNLRHLQLRVATHLSPVEIPVLTSDLPYLLTLSRVTLSSFTHTKFVGIFSIIKLGVCETHEDSITDGLWEIFFEDLALFKHVQTLKLACFGRNKRPLPMPSRDAFPHSLKKLTLWRSYLTWEAMTSLAQLPNLEVLKLRNYAFQGPEWKTVEGGFQRLKYLLIEETNLEVWILEDSHFPQLRSLVLKFCNKLDELPNEVGDICTLRKLELHFCSASAEQSAKDIQEEQRVQYCNDIEVLIRTHRTRSTSSLQALTE